MSAVRSARDERGSAAPFAVGVIGLLIFVGAALGVVGAVFVAHRTAQSAADLAALAGANALQVSEDACATARAIADRNGARLESCEIVDEDVTVTVQVEGPRWLGQPGDPVAEARAGPTD
ncbi:secretion/DNA translocation related TadE-like protein [Nocardioides albertanoniae]|uniref:Secretion/DNA translocation related TadE-like protein n=1 Tax=Nocardioides albertanoniae TaxID=1175486 RepID=A0A543A1R2_9ACTN|nr:Rv3654c family TadE-like protein [Nocardioides albertanoniae]TQL66518.1 secretion/DNA translocation related TadE-like protein [Nocardioides albertanoniae]